MHQTFGFISVPSMHGYDVKFSTVPFAPEPPVTVRIHVPSTACDVISFNDRGLQDRDYRF